MTKTETSLVMWLNIVTIVARRVCLLPAHMREDGQATRSVNDGLVNARRICFGFGVHLDT